MADRPAFKVRSKTLDELEASLVEIYREYLNDDVRRKELRTLVIKAKDRARFASRNPKAAAEKREVKTEMVEWMLVWLDDPSMFETWVALRRQAIARSQGQS